MPEKAEVSFGGESERRLFVRLVFYLISFLFVEVNSIHPCIFNFNLYLCGIFLNNQVMPRKPYKTIDNTPLAVGEPVAAYQKATVETSSSDDWNPNVPFHGTQEEWWEHFHRIEEGHFTPLEQHEKEFEAWKQEYLANRLK
jgi:hypothetical protein